MVLSTCVCLLDACLGIAWCTHCSVSLKVTEWISEMQRDMRCTRLELPLDCGTGQQNQSTKMIRTHQAVSHVLLHRGALGFLDSFEPERMHH